MATSTQTALCASSMTTATMKKIIDSGVNANFVVALTLGTINNMHP